MGWMKWPQEWWAWLDVIITNWLALSLQPMMNNIESCAVDYLYRTRNCSFAASLLDTSVGELNDVARMIHDNNFPIKVPKELNITRTNCKKERRNQMRLEIWKNTLHSSVIDNLTYIIYYTCSNMATDWQKHFVYSSLLCILNLWNNVYIFVYILYVSIHHFKLKAETWLHLWLNQT